MRSACQMKPRASWYSTGLAILPSTIAALYSAPATLSVSIAASVTSPGQSPVRLLHRAIGIRQRVVDQLQRPGVVVAALAGLHDVGQCLERAVERRHLVLGKRVLEVAVEFLGRVKKVRQRRVPLLLLHQFIADEQMAAQQARSGSQRRVPAAGWRCRSIARRLRRPRRHPAWRARRAARAGCCPADRGGARPDIGAHARRCCLGQRPERARCDARRGGPGDHECADADPDLVLGSS